MLRAAEPADIGFVRSLASRPENAGFLTDEDEAALARYLSDPEARMLIWGPDAPCGFAIFCDIGFPSGAICLMRLALKEPGRGEGKVFLRRLIDHGFEALQAKRLWLDASGENTRAHRAYLRAGFTLEGRLRQHEYVPRIGRVIDTLYFGMLRSEWESLEPLSDEA
jgi:GNAT superfamily N-acetyltransferase